MDCYAAPATGKDRVLGAALRLFAERGFDRVTIRDIGLAAGFTNPALYRHYRGKEELGLDLYRRCYKRMVSTLRGLEGTGRNPLDKLVGYVPAIVGLYEADPFVVQYVDEHQVRFWPELRHEFEPDTLSSILARWVRQGQKAGSIRTDISVEGLTALPLGLVTQWLAMRSAKLCVTADTDELESLVRSAVSSSTRTLKG